MTDFPNNFDYVIYGTGVTESILSSALSVIGRNVLHIDKHSYYGVYNGCLRLNELESTLNDWKEDREHSMSTDINMFSNNESQVSFIDFSWHFKNNVTTDTINGVDGNTSTNGEITEASLRQRIRGFEFELIPKLVYCESQIVDALIQSDVTRYLEFKFVSKFASISDNKIISIPINRSDIVKTRVFSLRQKRQLTSFLEWCFTVSLDDDLLTKYANQPLYELMRNEKNIDSFTENIIIQCLALSSPAVETKEGTLQIKRLLKSFNKFGPYPIMWPNYGSGEIPQAFCRMSAVFGGIYCLNTSIRSCTFQATENGNSSIQDSDSTIPISHRKLKITLSNDSEVYTDKIICSKSYINPSLFVNPQSKSWVCRAILITDRSLLNANREANDILMLPMQLAQVNRPVVLLELPTDKRADSAFDVFVTHLVAYSNTCLNAKELFSDIIDQFYVPYNLDPTDDTVAESTKPNIFFHCYFSLPNYTDVSIDTNLPEYADLSRHTVFVNDSLDNFEFEDCIKEARELFSHICPGDEFLPRPPNPEDIILLGDDVVAVGSPTGGDFPFESSIDSSTMDGPLAPGDICPGEEDIVAAQLQGPTLSALLAEIDLNATQSERDEPLP